MIEFEEALERILAALPLPEPERLPLAEAHQRVLAERVVASTDLPPFDNSAMDGYAIRAEDVANATPEAPIRLRLCGRITAGETFAGRIGSGECARLFTGSPLPAGADAVVMQEDSRVDSAAPGEVLICDAAKPGENVRLRGNDVKRGMALAEVGEVLTAGRIGLLAASGVAEIKAGKRPRIGVLATGSELREPGQTLAAGQIYESNRVMLATLIRGAGGIPETFPLVPDTLADTRKALEQAFSRCDAVMTSGGVSVGEMDFVKAAFTELGGEPEFWKVAIRPGKPFVFGRRQGKMLLGLPGNPVSAFVTFLLLVRPALRRWQGSNAVALPEQPGLLAEPLANPGGRRHFMRVRVDATGKVFSAGAQASHALLPLASSDGLVDVLPQQTLAAGTVVPVLRWT